MPGFEPSGEQRRAIAHRSGALRIIACPGSGKTETVSRRVAELVRGGADPSGIVAFTFTVRAAGELRRRIRSLLGQNARAASDVFVGTIDSFCLRTLKELRPEYAAFEVLEPAARDAFLDRRYERLGVDRLARGRRRWETIEKFLRSADVLAAERIDTARISDREFAGCYERYLAMMREERFFDFSTVAAELLHALEDAGTRGRVAQKVRHVVMDEYQDANGLQEAMLEELSEGAESVCVVGDDDQNIFEWRGSSAEYIRDFPEKYGAETVDLGVNYRATRGLVDSAARLISNNRSRVKKDMRAHEGQPNESEPGDVVHKRFASWPKERGFVLEAVRNLRGAAFRERGGAVRGLSYGDVAVLVRTNGDASAVARLLKRGGIPYAADSGAGDMAMPAARLAADCLMYAFGHHGLAQNKVPDPGSLARRYSKYVGGDGARFLAGLEAVRRRAVEAATQWQLPGRGLQGFYHAVLAAMGAERGELGGVMRELASLSAAVADYEQANWPVGAARVAGLKWFLSMSSEAGRRRRDLDAPPRPDAVRVLTIWKAKGLEFPAVLVPRFDEQGRDDAPGLFVDADLLPASYSGGDEAERRAYYTAVTRSQKYLLVTGAGLQHRFSEELRLEGGPWPPGGRAAPQAGRLEQEPLETSHSRLSVYARCPYEYMLRHVAGFSAGAPAELGYGASVHRALNLAHKECAERGRAPDASAMEAIMDDAFYMRFVSADQRSRMKHAAAQAVMGYVGGLDPGSVVASEARFKMDLGGALVTGAIDLVRRGEEGLEIIDFKAGRSDDQYGEAHEDQVRLYVLAARESLGLRAERAFVHYLRERRDAEVDVGEDALRGARDRAARMAEMIAAAKFDPAPEKKKCLGCDFRRLCPHKGFQEGPRGNGRDAGIMGYDEGRRGGPEGGASGRRPSARGGRRPGPSVVSATVKKNAEALAALGIERAEDGSYSVPSLRDPGKAYIVADAKCSCRGFRGYPSRHPGTTPTCSHVEAVKLTLERAGPGGGSGV